MFLGMGITEALVHEKAQTFTNLMWSRGNPDFCENIRTFSARLSELDQMVRRMVVESLGLEKYWDEHIEVTRYLLRVMKYKVSKTTEPSVGLKAHADKNMVTILHQNQVGGLEIETKCGEWIKVKPSSSNSFIVMAAESLHAWTNGRVHAPYHRVVMTGTEARFSLGLFSVLKEGITVKVPDEMVDEQHPLLFDPFDYGEFMKFYTAKLGELNDEQYALTSYCGVL